MPPLAWWLLHAAQAAALVLALVFALVAARRAGGHTLYGNLLFLLALGFWSLLLGEALFSGRQAMDAWQGPGSFNDVLNLMGWLLLWASILLFVERFSPAPPRQGRRYAAPLALAAYMAVPAALVAWGFHAWLSPPGTDPDALLRLVYLLIDALTIGVILGGLDRFLRLRKSALGRLYLYLGAAILLKTAGDAYWAYLAARDATSLLATAFYPAAGVLVVVGLGLHVRHMRREALEQAPYSPWLRPQQQYLTSLAARLQDLGGGYAARTALLAAGSALGRHGAAWRIEGMGLESDADEEAWRHALRAADQVAVDLLGTSGKDLLHDLATPLVRAA